MPGRRGTGIYISGTSCAGVSRAVVVRRWVAGPASVRGVRLSRPLPAVILRALLVRPLLILVRPLLRLVLALRILIRPLLVLIWPLLISELAPILGSILPRLHLRISKLAPGGAALDTTLAWSRSRAQAEKQDRSGNCRRTHSLRVVSPVHKSISEGAPNRLRVGSERTPLGAWLPASAEM